MAKFEKRLRGDFNEILTRIEQGVLRKNKSASFEDGSDYSADNVRCAVRVFERYSMIGSNRVSLSITLMGRGDELFVSAITSGGSQAVFFKINTIGEETFLEVVIDIVNDYIRNKC